MSSGFGLNGFNFGFGNDKTQMPMTLPGSVPGIATFGNTQGASDAVSQALKTSGNNAMTLPSTVIPAANNNWSLDGATVSDKVTPASVLGDAVAKGNGKNSGDLGDSTEFGMNLGTGKLALGGIQAVGNLWAAWQANKLAKEQFAYQKNVSEQNLANQIQSYNTGLEDRMRGRTAVEAGQAGGTTAESAAAYLSDHKLVRRA